MRLALFLILLPNLAFAECPAQPDRSEQRLDLLGALRMSQSPQEANTAANQLWEFWMVAPDETAQKMLNEGMSRRESYAYAEAEETLDALVAYCPNFAEGWNQRAFVRYLRENFEGSILDIETTLSLEPDHFGALSGKALALMGQGDWAAAKLAIIRARGVHPWLSEHGLLTGEDI